YAQQWADRHGVAAALKQHHIATSGFVCRAVKKAEGNFQYLAALFGALQHAIEREDNEGLSIYLSLDQLPTNLADLYAFLIEQVRRLVGALTVERPGAGPFDPPIRQAAWQGLYQPILGILTVAGKPLLKQQIARFLEIPPGDRWFTQALVDLTPLL